MKRGLLLLLGMLIMVSSVEANNGHKLTNRIGVNYSYDNAVNFVERGVEFFVFTNGEFDFDTRYRNIRIPIRRDFRGRIQRVGSVFINYDYFGNVTRIGNISMRYYRGQLINVGNLRIQYDRWGYPNFYGQVRSNFYNHNGIRINLNIGDICDYNDTYFFGRDFRRNYSQIREDRNYYYYRANPNARIGKRSQILRRRKPVAQKVRNRVPNRRENNTYRKDRNRSNSNRIGNSNPNRRNNNTIRKTETIRKPASTKRISNRRSVLKQDTKTNNTSKKIWRN